MFRTRFMVIMRFVLPALLFPMLSGCGFKDVANAAQTGILGAVNGAFNTVLTNIIFSNLNQSIVVRLDESLLVT